MEAIRGGADKGAAGDTAVVRVDRKESRTDYARWLSFCPSGFRFQQAFPLTNCPSMRPLQKSRMCSI